MTERKSIVSAVRRVQALFGGGRPKQGEPNDLTHITYLFLPVIALATAAAAWVGWSADAVAPVLLWVFASFVAGGTMGFLFGIPKSGSTWKNGGRNGTSAGESGKDISVLPGASGRARPNTNLEEVSDWLTKIIVGLTLVNLKDISAEVGGISQKAAYAIRANPGESDASVATALVVGFSLIGFLCVYLYMRLFLQGAMVRSDEQMSRYMEAVELAGRVGERESQVSDELAPIPSIPSEASVKAAQAVADAAPSDPEVILNPLRQLANEYESLRRHADYSPERTRQMTEIVRRMRPHAIAAAPYIAELMCSTSTGEHLAATVILQMKYMPEHMHWLARRIVEERAFIGYQAASALLARVRVAGVPECKAIQQAVQAAKNDRDRLGLSEASLDELIGQILRDR
ncbi:hypothetical protein [Paracidovorax avenae]|uniref:hypothetical protein n=1 Tax=Paracidovorax avenae TaxID=80867 RepID=UPI001AD83A21|nr:hypothetical protein [Paracidovorax avenae]